MNPDGDDPVFLCQNLFNFERIHPGDAETNPVHPGNPVHIIQLIVFRSLRFPICICKMIGEFRVIGDSVLVGNI